MFDQRRVKQLLRAPMTRFRFALGGGGAAIGLLGLVATSWDRPLSWSLVTYGVYALTVLSVEVAMSSAKADDPSGKPQRLDRSQLNEFGAQTQAVVLTLTGTVLGLLTAFTDEALTPASKGAVIALVACALVQFALQAMASRHISQGSVVAQRIASGGDAIAGGLLAFGLIALAAALLSRG